jgi:hypothetical protein
MQTLTADVRPDSYRTTSSRHLCRIAGSVIAPLVLFCSQTAPAAVITVTGTGTTVAVDGVVTLAEALISANNNASVNADVSNQNPGGYGTDTINFNIPGAGVHIVGPTPGAPLPVITGPIIINGYSQPGASANTIANSGNAVILIDVDGTNAGGGINGLTLGSGSAGSTIKGLAINRFTANGIVIQSNANTIVGNFIGTNAAGTARSPNGTFPTSGDGVLIQNSSNNIIGTAAPADRNVISGNALNGVHIVGTIIAPATGNKIQGNFIGIDKGGINGVGSRTEPAPAPGATEGNNLFGIEISGGTNNIVGGTAAGARNVIGFNAAGIDLTNGAQSNTIQGNFIGVGANGVTPTGNLLQGVSLRSSSGFSAPLGPAQPNEPGTSLNLIGGTSAGAGNLIEFNGAGGVVVFGNPVSASGQANLSNAIEGNNIFENGRSVGSPLPLGIDLSNQFAYPKDDGVTPNDSHSAPSDPNAFRNFPVLRSATSSGGTTKITGTLSSVANTMFRIEFFANDPDPLGLPPEGQQFLGFTNATTDASGNLSFNVSFIVSVTGDRLVTATATDAIGNTSEFSAAKLLTTQALNISTRMSVQTGNNVLIAGFIVTGVDQKTVAVRGIGPSLAQFFSGTLTDPTLELHTGNVTLATNDNWQDDSSQATQLSAHGLALSDPKEAGIVTILPAQASYTAVLAGKNNETGIGLVELYDLDQTANSELANISTRGFVQTGNNVMIGGFILGGNGTGTRVVVRGIGPSLAQFGLNPVLADPTLELHDGNGVTIVANDNWQDDAQYVSLIANGLAPSDPNEAATLLSLPPGQFTAVLAGKNGGIGIGLVEIYNLH